MQVLEERGDDAAGRGEVFAFFAQIENFLDE